MKSGLLDQVHRKAAEGLVLYKYTKGFHIVFYLFGIVCLLCHGSASSLRNRGFTKPCLLRIESFMNVSSLNLNNHSRSYI